MNEEIMRILKMVEEGKLNADKAKELIDALEQLGTRISSCTKLCFCSNSF